MAILLCLCSALTGAVATAPPLPAEYSGTVTIDGDPAPVGTVIVALLGGEERGRLVTAAPGSFGGEGTFAPRLVVTAAETDDDWTVAFLVEGALAAESVTLVAGSVQDIDLTVSASSLRVTVLPGTTQVIPTDTDGAIGVGDAALIGVAVSGSVGVRSVTIDLSGIGGATVTPMIGAGDGTWTATVSSAVPSPFEGGVYLPVLLHVNATPTEGVSNTSVAIPLTVVQSGDTNEDNRVTLYDAVYTARHLLEIEGYAMTESVGMVSGGEDLSLADAMYLAKHLLGLPGFETLH